MNLLVTCHCLKSDVPLTISPTPSSVSYVNVATPEFENEHVIPCKKVKDLQYTAWSDVPSDSFDVIYGVSCPLYGSFYEEEDLHRNEESDSVWKSFNTDVPRVLRKNGTLVIPILPFDKYDLSKKALTKMIADSMPRWSFTFSKTSPFIVKAKGQPYEQNYILFKKTTDKNGGLRKTQGKGKKTKTKSTTRRIKKH